jgi:PBP1b-binding outer membrane lipoprotein LpoB
MKKLPIILFLSIILLILSVCSEAPEVELQEATNRVVLAEVFTEDF